MDDAGLDDPLSLRLLGTARRAVAFITSMGRRHHTAGNPELSRDNDPPVGAVQPGPVARIGVVGFRDGPDAVRLSGMAGNPIAAPMAAIPVCIPTSGRDGTYRQDDDAGDQPVDLRHTRRRRGLPPTHLSEHRFAKRYPASPIAGHIPCHRLARRYHEGHRHAVSQVIYRWEKGWTRAQVDELIDDIALAFGLWQFPQCDDEDFALSSLEWPNEHR